jgi:hypothetical protein
MSPALSRPLIFRSGINHLIAKLHPIQIVTIAIHIEPLRHMKPTVLIKAGSTFLSGVPRLSHEDLAKRTEQHLDEVALNWTAQLYSQQAPQ